MSKKSPKVKINDIELEIGKNKIKLSIEAAKELKEVLNELFADEKDTVYVPYRTYDNYRNKRWTDPINPWYPSGPFWSVQPYITSSGTAATLTISNEKATKAEDLLTFNDNTTLGPVEQFLTSSEDSSINNGSVNF